MFNRDGCGALIRSALFVLQEKESRQAAPVLRESGYSHGFVGRGTLTFPAFVVKYNRKMFTHRLSGASKTNASENNVSAPTGRRTSNKCPGET